jgi:hypothetical protein
VPAFLWAICLVPPYALAGLLLQRDLIRQIEANQKGRPLIKWFIYLVLVGAMESMNYVIWAGFLTHPAYTSSSGYATLKAFIYFAMYAYAPLLFIWGATGIKTAAGRRRRHRRHHRHYRHHRHHRHHADQIPNNRWPADAPYYMYPTPAFVSMKHNSKGTAKPSRVALLYGRCSAKV